MYYLSLLFLSFGNRKENEQDFLPRPPMIPTFLGGRVGLNSGILNGNALPDIILQHGNLVQSPLSTPRPILLCTLSTRLCGRLSIRDLLLRRQSVSINQSQCFTRVSHGIVLSFELPFAFLTQGVLVPHPRAMNGPVAEEACAREAQRPGGERVVEKVADEGHSGVAVYGGFLLMRGRAGEGTGGGSL